MEEANDADGPNGGRKAHKKKIRRIEDSDDSECDTENNQLTSRRRSSRPAMDHTFQRSSSEGSDDSSDSSDDIDSVNTGESTEDDSNESNADLSSEWDTESENEEEEEDISRPSTSRACTRGSRTSSHSSNLPDKELSPAHLSSDRMATEGPVNEVEGKVIAKDQDDFRGSSSETDDGEGPKTRCPICLRSLPGPGGAEVGSPEGCQHCFCVQCIQEWAKNVNTCPVDRHEFSEIVVLDGVCGKELRRLPLPRKTRSSGTQEDDDVTVISQIEEDPTYCEVCGSGDREDSLLLCDGCDRGYHLECLIPPLTSVPIEEWFCPACTEAATSRHRSGRAARSTRLLPRTSASQRVLRNLRRNTRVERGQRGLRTWNLADQDLEVMEELAELEAERRWAANMSNSGRPSTSKGFGGTSRRKPIKKKRKVYRKKTTRKKRKTVTKKRTILGKDGEEEEEEVEEEEVTTTSKRKGRKRRKVGGRRSRRTRKQRAMSKRFKGRSRLAETLGIVPGKESLLKRKGACGRGGVGGATGYYGGDGGVVLNGTTSGVGSRVPTLSIFGSCNDLEFFSEGSDIEGGGGSLAVVSAPRPVDSVHARQLAKERLMTSSGTAAERRKAMIKERAIAAASPSNSSGGVPDLLGSIMDSQAVWHGRKSRVKLNSDGSFVIDKPKNGAHSQAAEHGDVPSSVSGPKSVEITSLNNEVNVSSSNTRVPSNPAEPSTAAQDSCSTFREGNSGVGLHDRVASVESHKAIEGGRSVWPIRTPETDLRATSSGLNRKERVPFQNVNEMVFPSRVLTSAGPGSTPTRSRATNNFRSIEHLAGNVIVNSNPDYVDEDHTRVIWDTRPLPSVKNDMGSVITSNYSRLTGSIPERAVIGGVSFGSYESPNSPLDLSNSSHKADNNGGELLHRNMYLDLSSGGSRRNDSSVEQCFQNTPRDTTAEDLRVLPIPMSQTPPHFRSHSVIRENPAMELSSRAYGEPLSQDIHSNMSELPPLVSETVNSALITPLEAVKTVGLPGSSGNDNTNQSVNSSVRDVAGGRTSSGGGTRGTSQRVEYARTNSSYSNTSGSREATNPGHGGGGGGGDRNNRPQLLKRRVDEDDDEDKDDREDDEDEDVDIYSDIEPGGSDPPPDNHGERHGVPVNAIEIPSDQGAMYHPSVQTSGSDKYDPAEPSYDTDDEMVIDEEGGNEEESHTSRSASLEGEIPPPPPLPPTLLDSITKPDGGMDLSPQSYDRERSVTPTEEDERRKEIGKESDTVGRPPVGVRVYGILSQGKFGLGVSGYGSDDEEEDDEGCPNFSIYSAASMDIARTADTTEEVPKKETVEPTPSEGNLDEPSVAKNKDLSSTDQVVIPEESSEDQSDSNKLPSPEEQVTSVEELSKEEAGGDDSTIGDEINYEKDVEKSDAEKSDAEKSDDKSDVEKSDDKSDADKSDADKSDDEAEKSDVKSDVEVEKSDAEPEKSDADVEKSDLEVEKSDNEKSDTEPEKLAESKSQEGSIIEDEPNLEAISDKEFDTTKESKEEKDVHSKDERENLEDSERSAILVPELEGLETETISEAEEATAFEDLEASKRRSCGGEEEEGEIVDDRVREKTIDKLTEKIVIDEAVKESTMTEPVKTADAPKKDSKKEGKRRTRKKADSSKTDEVGGDSAIAWKKLSKTGKERNYRDAKTEDPSKSKKDVEDKEDKENRRGKKERDKRKSKRKDLERYDVRKVVGERSKTKRRRTDAFGRELRSNSRSRSRSRLLSRSRSRGIRSRSRGGRSRSRVRSRSRGIRSRSRGARSRSRGRWSRSRRSRSRGTSRARASSKTRRSRSRGKARSGRTRSRSRARQRSRSRGGRSRSRGGRSRSRQKSRERAGRRGENGKTATRKRRRSRSPISERKRQSRSRSRQRKRSRSRSRRRKTDQLQDSWEKSWSRSWTRSVTPVHSRSMEKSRGHMRSRSMSGSRVYHDRTPPPLSRTPSRSRGRSLCRSPSTPNLPPPQRGRLGMQSLSRSPSRTPERLRSPAVAAIGNKKKKRKKDGRRKDVEVIGKKKKKRRERSPAASKEVFASGDNILVSVSFKSAPKETSNAPKRRKASSPVEEKVKVVEEPVVDAGTKKKRKFMPVVKKKPSVIIDLETSPFVERIPSPADLIVLSDSSGENDDKVTKQQQQLESDSQRRHRMMMMSPVTSRKLGSNGVKEKRKVGKKGKLGGKGKKTVGKKERKAAAAAAAAGIPPPEPTSMEEPPMPLAVPEEPTIERRLGPKTPPEPQVKFCIASKGTQLRSVNNPLREDDDDEDVDDEIITSETISSAPMDIGQQNVPNEVEMLPVSNGDTTPGELEVRQAIQVGPNTPPGPSTPDAEGTFIEAGPGQESPPPPQEEVISRAEEVKEDVNKDSTTFEEPARKDQEMDTYDPFEPTNSPAPSPPAPETEQVHQAAEESRDVTTNSVDGTSQAVEDRPPEEEVAVAEPRAEEPVEPKVEEAAPPPTQGTVQGVANIARTLGTTVGAIDAVGGLVLPLLAQLGAVAQPLNAAVAAVTSANSPIIQQQQLSPLVNRAFPQQPPQAKAADVIRSLFGSGLRQFPEMVAISGTAGAFSASQPKTSKTDISLGGGARVKGGPRVAVTAPRVAVATPRVVAPTPRVAITPRVATANGKDQAPGSGQDRVDVVDMDLESPYSPASSEGDDLFEPPSYESAGSARQPSILNQTQQPSKAAVKGNQRPAAPGATQDKFDSLFGSSPMRRNANSTGGKMTQRSVKNHKGSSKSGKPRSKGGKVNVRSEDDHHLTILDELPNSAVEMQVKEKFMIKLNRQERVVEEVKLALKPHYNKKHLSKEEYKDILRRSVPKICHNRHGEINPIRIRSLVEAYVKKFRYARKKDANAVQGAVRSGKGKKVA